MMYGVRVALRYPERGGHEVWEKSFTAQNSDYAVIRMLAYLSDLSDKYGWDCYCTNIWITDFETDWHEVTDKYKEVV